MITDEVTAQGNGSLFSAQKRPVATMVATG